MSPLRQALYGIALLGTLALLIWGQQQRIDAADGKAARANDAAKTAREDANRNLATVNTLTTTCSTNAKASPLCAPSRTSCAWPWQSAHEP